MNIKITDANRIVIETEFGTITIDDTRNMFNETHVRVVPNASPTARLEITRFDDESVLIQAGPPRYRNTALKDFDEEVS